MKTKLLTALLIASSLAVIAKTQVIESPYVMPLVQNRDEGPAYSAEFMTAAKNGKTGVSVLVIPQIKYIKPKKDDPKQFRKTAEKKAKPNVLDAEIVEIVKNKPRLVCRSIGKTEDPKDERKAVIFQFEPSCFAGDSVKEIRLYADVKDASGAYRYSSQTISEQLKEAIKKDFSL